MSVQQAIDKFNALLGDFAPTSDGLITDSGKLLAHSLFPDDFEFYMMGFELIDTGNNRVVTDRLVLPVNPDSLDMGLGKITNLKKTASGMTVLSNNSFVPIPITLTGGFGRQFRLLVGNKQTASRRAGFENLPDQPPFIPNIKTGYGALKLLQRIYDKSSMEGTNGKPYLVNFYNLAFNQSFLVEFTDLKVSMSKEQNMLWQYTLQMTAIAPSTSVSGQILSGAVRTGGIGAINKKIHDLGTSVTKNFII